MSEIDAHHEAETRRDIVGSPAGVPGPLKDAGGAAIPYGCKPLTAPAAIFPSAKNGCDVPVHDRFELAFARQAERSPMVEWYEARTTFLLGMLPFDYVPSFAVNLWFGSMVVEITELGMPSDEEEARRAATIRESLDGAGIMFAQFSTREVSRCKLLGRSRPLRPRTNDYWLRAEQARNAEFWANFPWLGKRRAS